MKNIKTKISVLFILFATLFCTSCVEFVEWVEEENDKSYTYKYVISEISSSEYKLLFRDKYGWDQLDYDNCYSKENDDFSRKADAVTDRDIRIESSIAAKWSTIEENLQNNYNFSSRKTWRIENRLRNDEEVLFVNETTTGSYLCLYIKLVNVRY